MPALDGHESLALIICGSVVFMLMLTIPYVFGWWRRK